MTPPRRLRVLLVAEACNPDWPSVPLVGYNFARALADRPDLDVTLATHPRNRPQLDASPLPARCEVVYVDNEWIARPLYKLATRLRGGAGLSWTVAMALGWPAYLAFEHQLYQTLRRPLARGRFDLVHRVTPLTPTYGSPLAGLAPHVPFLLGPLNGGLPWPNEFPELRRREREWLAPVRRAYRLLPYFRTTYAHAAAVIAGSRHTATEVPKWFRGRRYYLPENGIDPDRFPIADDWPAPSGPLTFVAVGRLVPYKGFDLTLEAMRDSPLLRTCRLRIIGDGPERGRLEKLVKDAGLGGLVSFLGWLDQSAVGRELAAAQALAFPSLREFGGAVVLEAMACAVPPVVVDYGGPAELVGDAGVRVPLAPRAELIPLLRAAMERLAGDPAECRRLGRAASRRVRQEFVWPAKAARLAAIYREVVARR